ncbi:MAG: hypothetical protein PWR08_1005, partial [Thermoanaerobacterium sp.]|nr:hypothetical protein [Thermoanaerobacterium sp.]
GLYVALKTGGKDIISYFASIKTGVVPLLIILLSTVTTTFMDVYSAAVSTLSIVKAKLSRKSLLIVYSIVGLIAAYLFPIDNYQNFLYAIGSVFIPAYTVVFEDYFLMKSKSDKLLNVPAAISFIVGALTYNYLTYFGGYLSKWFMTPTIGTIILTAVIYPVIKSLNKREEKIYD